MRDFPSIGEYNTTIQNSGGGAFNLMKGISFIPSKSFPIKVFLFGSGAYAVVFKGNANGQSFAIRCFLTVDQETIDRYQLIGNYLKNISSSWKTDFEFIDSEILVKNKRYPIIKMEWVEGVLINQYVTNHLNNNNILTEIQRQIVDISHDLELNDIGHGDLQCGNIIITGNDVNFQIKLIDYDGMYIPSFTGRRSIEKGRSEFQHPRRNMQDFNSKIDRFSIWVMLTALEAIKYDKSLWNEVMKGGFNTLDNFLFTVHDFQDPNHSALFKKLYNTNIPSLKFYMDGLKSFCTGNIGSVAKPELFDQEPSSAIAAPPVIPKSFTHPTQNVPINNPIQVKNHEFNNDILYNEALTKYKKGDIDGALIILEKGLKLLPNNEPYLKLKALVELKQSEIKQNEKIFNDAKSAVDVKDFEMAQLIIDQLIKKEQKNEYVALREKIKNSINNIQRAKLDFEKGNQLFEKGEYENAIRHYRSAISLEDNETYALALTDSIEILKDKYYDEASSFFKSNLHQKALTTLDALIQLDPTNAKASELKSIINKSLSKRKKISTTIKLSVIGVAIVLISIGFYLYEKGADDRKAWQIVLSNPNYEAFNEYIKHFPKGINFSIAQDSISKITERENEEWKNLRYGNASIVDTLKLTGYNNQTTNFRTQTRTYSDNPIAVVKAYMQEHPGGVNGKLATETLDSLYWDLCQKDKSKESCELYLSNVKDGKFSTQVNEMLKEIVQTTVSESEKIRYTRIINSFYEQLYSKNFALLMDLFPSSIDYFGRHSMSKEAVIQSINQYMTNNHIESERNSINWGSFESKHIGSGATIVKFNMEYYCKKQYPPGETHYSVDVTLVFNNEDKISSYNQIVRHNYGDTEQ